MRIADFFIVALGLLLFYSCSNSEKSDKIVYLTEEDLPPVQPIEFEKIDLPEDECMDSYYYVYHDSVLVTMHRTPDPYWLTIMNLNSKEVLSNYIIKGNGPEKMIFCYNSLRDNRLIVSDPRQVRMKIFNLDSIMQLNKTYNPQMYYQDNSEYKDVDVLTDTSFIFYNRWYFDNCSKEANMDIPELIVTGKDAKFTYNPPAEATIDGYISNTYIFTNLDRQRTFIAYACKPQFTILNSSLDTIKIVCGPEPVEIVDNGKLERYFSGEFVNEYIGLSFSTKNYIFAINSRIHNVSRKDLKEARKNNPELFKFDWDGNVVARYKIGECYNLSGFSETTNTLYVTKFDEDGELCLYKAQLD